MEHFQIHSTRPMIAKPDKDTTKKWKKKKKRKLQVIIFDAHKCKYFQENISKLNPIIKSYYDDQVEFIPESQ